MRLYPGSYGARRSQHPRARQLLARAAFEALEPRRLLNGVIINEVMASNIGTGLLDEDADHSDWIELRNPTPAPVNLFNHFLTDDMAVKNKWAIPNVSIPANGYLVIFASGKDRRPSSGPLHTNFSIAAEGEYIALVAPDAQTVISQYNPLPPQTYGVSYGPGETHSVQTLLTQGSPTTAFIPPNDSLGIDWTAPGFPDGDWMPGSNGVGYDTDTIPPIVGGFNLRMVDVGTAGADSQINSLAEAISILEGTYNPGTYQIAFDGQADAPTINHGNGGSYGSDRVYPNGLGGTSGNQDAAGRTDYVIRATANVTIPAGQWTINVNSDDGFRLRIPGITFLARTNENGQTNPPDAGTLMYAAGRGPGNTFGTFTLASPLSTTLILEMYERSGGDSIELSIANGHQITFVDTTTFQLLGDNVKGWAVKTQSINPPPNYLQFIGTNVLQQMRNVNQTVYARIPFTLSPGQTFDQLMLRMRYDDGFFAYLNGQLVASRFAPGTPSWNSGATANRNESLAFLYEDINISAFTNALIPGAQNVLAIHGLNFGAGSSDMLVQAELIGTKIVSSGIRYFENPTPGGLNAPSPYEQLVAKPELSLDHGFFSGPVQLAITTDTPGATIRYTTNGAEPTATTGSLYTGPFTISATTPLRARAFLPNGVPSEIATASYLFLNDVIQQAPDGSPPPGWPATWGANVVDYGMDPDIVNSPTYSGRIVDALQSLPSFSIVMDLKDLFDPVSGIYANPGGDEKTWERATSMELLFPDGTPGFQSNAGIRIRGGFSRSTANPKHALRFFFRDEYGAGKLEYPVFGPDGATSFDGFDLRTFQNYSWSFQGDARGVFIRDLFSRDTQIDMGQPAERGDYFHLYINGQYWGIYNSDERPEASYGASTFGGDKADYDAIKQSSDCGGCVSATDGNMTAWTQLWQLTEGPMNDAVYQQIIGNNPDGTRNLAYPVLLDADNLIDYMMVIYYGGNLDAAISNFRGNNAPNNFFALRNRTTDEGFRFFAHDSEHTLLTHVLDGVNQDRTGPWPAGQTLQFSNPQRFFQQLWQSPEFRMRVADRIHGYFFNGGLLTPKANIARFMRRVQELDRAVVAESARWGDSKVAVPHTRDVQWLNEINNLISNYFPQRSEIVLNQFRNKNLYPTLAAPVYSQHGGMAPPGFMLDVTAPDGGTIYYTTDGSDPRLLGGALSPTALTYSSPFAVIGGMTVKSRVRAADGTWSALNQATFEGSPIRISEIMYNPGSGAGAQDFEFIELINTGSTAVNIQNYRLAGGINFTFPNLLLGPGERTVVAQNITAFSQRYPGVAVAGQYGPADNLSNGGEQIRLENPAGQLILDFAYSDEWFATTTDGGSYSLVFRDPGTSNLALYSQKDGWRPSDKVFGGPGAPDPGHNPDAVVINEVVSKTSGTLGDWIELRNNTPAAIDISGWFLSDDGGNLTKYRIPNQTVIQPGGYRIFFQNLHFGTGPTAFALSDLGETVYLSSMDSPGVGGGYRDSKTFGAAFTNMATGEYVKSTGGTDFTPLLSPTPGSANASARFGPVVINEVMYGPAGGGIEYIELYNPTSQSVALHDPANPANGYRLRIGANNTFTFTDSPTIPANGYIVIAPSGTDVNAFRAANSVPAPVPIYAGYPGALNNGGEEVELLQPLAPDAGNVPYVRIDRVNYRNSSPWPASPDSTGPSLARRGPFEYGNTALNWAAERIGGSPGRLNFQEDPPAVTITDVAPDPRTSPLNSITIVFSEPVTGFNINALTLSRNGGPNLLGQGPHTLTSSDGGVTWVLAGLSSVTGAAGSYSIILNPLAADIRDLAGNALTSGDSDIFQMATTIIEGDGGVNDFFVKRAGSELHVFLNETGAGPPDHVFALGQSQFFLTVNGRGDNDRIFVDYSGGDPFVGGALRLNQDGNAAEGVDSVMVFGTAGNDSFTIDQLGLSYGGSRVYTLFTNAMTLHGGDGNDTFNLSTTLAYAPIFSGGAGNDRLNINNVANFFPTFDGGAGQQTLSIGAGAYSIGHDLGAQLGPNANLIVNNSAQLTLNLPISLLSITMNSTSPTAPATLTLSASQVLDSLTINGTSRVNLAPGSSRFIRTRAFNISDTGILDLNDNDLILRPANATERALLFARLKNRIGFARNGSLWNQAGVTSTAARNNVARTTGLVLLINDHNGNLIQSSLDGEALLLGDIIVKYSWDGDSDASGKLDADDYRRLDAGFLRRLTDYRNSDLDYDGFIDIDDYILMDKAFLGQGGVL